MALKLISPLQSRNIEQKNYIKLILANDITFCTGKAGSGKTHVAIGMAAEALSQGKIRRIVLCRPAVEVGASIGFLPGNYEEKVAPFMRPLFDELSYYFDSRTSRELMLDGSIELAPLSLMRGRTFKDSFIILDEAQNATLAELKLFLTRIGGGSKMIITGDTTQSDIDNTGLDYVIRRLEGMDRIGIIELQEILRHSIIDAILERL